MKEIGIRIRKLREEKAISVGALGAASGINKATLSLIERGETTNPGVVTLMGIADALGVSVLAFLDDEEFKKAFQKVRLESLNAKYGDLIKDFMLPDERAAVA